MLHWRQQRHTAADTGAKALIATGAQNLGAFCIHVGTAGYLQLFDAAAAADVNLGTTAPTISFYIPANVADIKSLMDGRVLYFSKGIVYAITTTATGSTLQAGSSTFWHEKE
jgi:hypothetical protein